MLNTNQLNQNHQKYIEINNRYPQEQYQQLKVQRNSLGNYINNLKKESN